VTPEELYERALREGLRTPPVEEWESWPFEGPVRPKALLPPLDAEPPRVGEGGVDCVHCGRPDDDYLWTDERWRLMPFPEPTGLPAVVILTPREHVAEVGDLPPELAADLGRVLGKVERALYALGEIGRVFTCRFGDGSEHLHFWLVARPARLPQVRTSFVFLWDDVLPPLPEDVWRANLERIAASLSAP
jgi:diadenosine tetraphosphate (Ap4A) HIT family hydrolase